jgi:(E)-4-hydroxy-3-methylbut-2-enyl-diphosphate synthase
MDTFIKRKRTKIIKLGSVEIGGDCPISVQTMTNTKTEDIQSTISQINAVASAGCDIVRSTVASADAVKAVKQIIEAVNIPFIADIHFKSEFAIGAIENGADGIRINPGNFPQKDLNKLIDAAKHNGKTIRIGVNTGSLNINIRKRYGNVDGLVNSALSYISVMESRNFYNIKISVKSSSLFETLLAYKCISDKVSYPLHLGLTEAGTLYNGIIKSSIGIGNLLLDGIGDTIRVSLTADPLEEVRAGQAILRALGLRKRGVEIISCPTCGRTEMNIELLAKSIEEMLQNIKSNIKVAVMGCIVNGPGEARQADYGIAGERGMGVIFKKGKIIKKVDEANLLNVFKEMLINDNILPKTTLE